MTPKVLGELVNVTLGFYFLLALTATHPRLLTSQVPRGPPGDAGAWRGCDFLPPYNLPLLNTILIPCSALGQEVAFP